VRADGREARPHRWPREQIGRERGLGFGYDVGTCPHRPPSARKINSEEERDVSIFYRPTEKGCDM
ncbi:hypothetical protein GWI33_008667, partial [Rhynchophorus ferrugineus]